MMEVLKVIVFVTGMFVWSGIVALGLMAVVRFMLELLETRDER